MSTTNSSAKRHRQSIKRRMTNRILKSRVKNSTKEFLTSVAEKSRDQAILEYRKLTSLIDKAMSKGVFHKNNGARKKSRLYKLINKTN